MAWHDMTWVELSRIWLFAHVSMVVVGESCLSRTVEVWRTSLTVLLACLLELWHPDDESVRLLLLLFVSC